MIVNIADLELGRWTQGTLYESADVSFAARLGLTRLGVSYNEVPPGKSGCPFHNHRNEDELFVVLEGTGLYRFGETQIPIRAGDILGAPAGGPETAHQILNTGDGPLRYLGLSNRAAADFVEYPDSGKFQAIARGPGKEPFRFVGRQAASADYWDGEPGA